jgi:hypothetical protein
MARRGAKRGHGNAENALPRNWMNLARPLSSAFFAGHDAPLIGERAAVRGSARKRYPV